MDFQQWLTKCGAGCMEWYADHAPDAMEQDRLDYHQSLIEYLIKRYQKYLEDV